jgi:hypothetical protein
MSPQAWPRRHSSQPNTKIPDRVKFKVSGFTDNGVGLSRPSGLAHQGVRTREIPDARRQRPLHCKGIRFPYWLGASKTVIVWSIATGLAEPLLPG